MTCPTGSNDSAILQMKEKAQGCIEKAKSSKLHKRNIWFLMDIQFWPKVSFGIGSISALFTTLEECLMKTYYDVLSVSRVWQSVKRELRQMDRGFYGVGFLHPGIECFIAQMGSY
jgi:hypothetical protein